MGVLGEIHKVSSYSTKVESAMHETRSISDNHYYGKTDYSKTSSTDNSNTKNFLNEVKIANETNDIIRESL